MRLRCHWRVLGSSGWHIALHGPLWIVGAPRAVTRPQRGQPRPLDDVLTQPQSGADVAEVAAQPVGSHRGQSARTPETAVERALERLSAATSSHPVMTALQKLDERTDPCRGRLTASIRPSRPLACRERGWRNEGLKGNSAQFDVCVAAYRTELQIALAPSYGLSDKQITPLPAHRTFKRFLETLTR